MYSTQVIWPGEKTFVAVYHCDGANKNNGQGFVGMSIHFLNEPGIAMGLEGSLLVEQLFSKSEFLPLNFSSKHLWNDVTHTNHRKFANCQAELASHGNVLDMIERDGLYIKGELYKFVFVPVADQKMAAVMKGCKGQNF